MYKVARVSGRKTTRALSRRFVSCLRFNLDDFPWDWYAGTKINMRPENHLFEKGKSSYKPPFLVSMLIFRGVFVPTNLPIY